MLLLCLFLQTQALALDADSLKPFSSLGLSILNSEKSSAIGFEIQGSYAAHTIVSNPPDSTQNDNRVGAVAGINTLLQFGNVNIDLEFFGLSEQKKVTDSLNSKYVLETSAFQIEQRSIAKIKIDSGIEAGGGFQIYYLSPSSEKVTGNTITTNTKFAKSFFVSPCGMLLKHGSTLAIGIAACLGTGVQRSFTQTASDGSTLSDKQEIYEPLGASGLIRLPLSFGLTNMELGFKQGDDHPEKSEQNAKTHQDSFFIATQYFLDPTAPADLGFFLRYDSASYADQAFMTIENMPVVHGEIRATLSSADSKFIVGIIGAYGADGQSLPQLNAKFTHKSLGLHLGLTKNF